MVLPTDVPIEIFWVAWHKLLQFLDNLLVLKGELGSWNNGWQVAILS